MTAKGARHARADGQRAERRAAKRAKRERRRSEPRHQHGADGR
jgi:hypothetical protein